MLFVYESRRFSGQFPMILEKKNFRILKLEGTLQNWPNCLLIMMWLLKQGGQGKGVLLILVNLHIITFKQKVSYFNYFLIQIVLPSN